MDFLRNLGLRNRTHSMKKTLDSGSFGPEEQNNFFVFAHPTVELVLYGENGIGDVYTNDAGKIVVKGKAGDATALVHKKMFEIKGMDAGVYASVDDSQLVGVNKINYSGHFNLNNGPGSNVVTGQSALELEMSLGRVTIIYGSGLNGQPQGYHHSAFGGSEGAGADYVDQHRGSKRDLFVDGPGSFFAPDSLLTWMRDTAEHSGFALQSMFGGGDDSRSGVDGGNINNSNGVHTEPASRFIFSVGEEGGMCLEAGLYRQNLEHTKTIGVFGLQAGDDGNIQIQGDQVDHIMAYALHGKYVYELDGMGKVSAAVRAINTTVEKIDKAEIDDEQLAFSLGFNHTEMGIDVNLSQTEGYKKNNLGQKTKLMNASVVYSGSQDSTYKVGLIYSDLDVDVATSGKLKTTTLWFNYKASDAVDFVVSHGSSDNTIKNDGTILANTADENNTQVLARFNF